MIKIGNRNNKFGVYDCLCLLLLLLPLHYYICECFLSKTKFDNVLRDFVIVILFLIALYKSRIKLGKHDLLVLANCFVMIIFAICSILKNSFPGTANILRTYLIPQLMFIIASHLKINEKQYRNINRIVVVGLSLIAIYGVFQAFVLGDKFLIKIGYPSNGNFLDGYSYYISGFFGNQRSVGTFISPNVCGAILSIAICVYLYSKVIKKNKLLLFFLVIGLIATFSRSAMIGLLLSIIVIMLLNGKRIKVTQKMLTIGLGSLVVGLLLVVYVDSRYFGGLFSDMIMRTLTSAFNSTDPSAKAHMGDLVEPLTLIIKHPFGLGFGNNGPMALELSNSANIVENSYYLMIYELGWIFGILFFAPYFLVIIETIKNKKYNNFLPASVAIVTCFTYILLPNVQTYEILFYSFMYMGFYYNRNVRNIFKKN